MKITKTKLKQIIKEELESVLSEGAADRLKGMGSMPGSRAMAQDDVQVGLGAKPPSRMADLELADQGVDAPKSRGEARKIARMMGELTYTFKGKKYGTRGRTETPEQHKRLMARNRERLDPQERKMLAKKMAAEADPLSDLENSPVYKELMRGFEDEATQTAITPPR